MRSGLARHISAPLDAQHLSPVFPMSQRSFWFIASFQGFSSAPIILASRQHSGPTSQALERASNLLSSGLNVQGVCRRTGLPIAIVTTMEASQIANAVVQRAQLSRVSPLFSYDKNYRDVVRTHFGALLCPATSNMLILPLPEIFI
jgi:hypothetical protein